MDTIDAKSQSGMSRRDMLRILGGVAAANGLGAATWGALELMVPAATAATWHKSVCRYCGTGCGVLIGMRDGRVTDIRDELAHNKGVICIKGAMLRELPYVKGRLTQPKIRRDGHLVEATWDEAMARGAEIQGSHRGFGTGCRGLLRFRDSSSPKSPTPPTNSSKPAFAPTTWTPMRGLHGFGGQRLHAGAQETNRLAATRIDYADCIFLIGANPFECHPPLFERVQQRRRASKKCQLIVVDPRRTRTAELADLHLAPVPGADLLLLNAGAGDLRRWIVGYGFHEACAFQRRPKHR